jgi:hypothetical protein
MTNVLARLDLLSLNPDPAPAGRGEILAHSRVDTQPHWPH